jgi:hypothetical protein
MDQGACCLAQMLKGRNVARNEAGNDAPDGETQDQGAGAEQNGDNAGACIYVSDCATAFIDGAADFYNKKSGMPDAAWSMWDRSKEKNH